MIQSSLKRDRLEIYYCILKSCIANEKHTRGSFNRQLLLPYSLLKESLMYLQQVELLHIDFDKRTIKTTLKGQEYVRKFDYLMQQMGAIFQRFALNINLTTKGGRSADIDHFQRFFHLNDILLNSKNTIV